MPYHRYAGYLKFLTLVLLVYVAAAFSVSVPWDRVMRRTLAPAVLSIETICSPIVAVFGTTISPYLFFWQASQEAEESRLSYRRALAAGDRPRDALLLAYLDRHLDRDGVLEPHRLLHHRHDGCHAQCTRHHEIETASQAAEALRPIAGELTFALFAAGIIGTGLLAVPVLAGSAAYAVAEAFGLRGSLELPRAGRLASMRSSARRRLAARRLRRPASIPSPCCSGPRSSTASSLFRSW